LCQGIPESAQEQQAPPTQAQPASSPPATGGNTGAAAAAPASGDEPINLFEAAAQAGQGNRGAGAGGARSAAAGGAAGAGGALGSNSLDFLRNNPQFQQLRQVVQQQPQMLEPILQQVGAGNPQLAQMIASHPDQFLQLLAEDADEDAPLPPGAQQISVTEEEHEAIERLCRLGFERDLVIQAYFACDKNEELAANFLFDHPDEPEEQ
jgi:UV excision repair protein RAD23